MHLNHIDKRILEILYDKKKALNLADFWSQSGFRHGEDLQPNLNKLKEKDFLKERTDPSRGRLYELAPKGIRFLEKPPLSRGEKIIVILTIIGIILTLAGIMVSITYTGK